MVTRRKLDTGGYIYRQISMKSSEEPDVYETTFVPGGERAICLRIGAINVNFPFSDGMWPSLPPTKVQRNVHYASKLFASDRPIPG